jgi:cell filamentation protein
VKENYTYLDPDYSYTDPESGVLKNKAGITDASLLLNYESLKVMACTEELAKRPVKIKDSSSLFAIHQYLFQDIYPWAGKKRTVEISKGGKQFFPTNHFDTALVYIDNLVAEYRKIDKTSKPALAKKLADILDTINYLHPFREGNGRTQREFLRVLALEKGYKLNLNPPNNADVYERYMSGTIDSDIDKLAKLLEKLMDGPGNG